MFTRYNILASLMIASSTASPLHTQQIRSTSINWGACNPIFNGTLPISCGNITVPLDYTLANSSTFELELLRVNAVKQPSKGSILINFGGPGVGVRADLAASGKELQTLTGGHYDLIGWDPRGVGNTLTFSCFEDATARGFDGLVKKLTLGNSSDTSLGRLWVAGELTATTCATYEPSKNVGELIGTAFTARDMMRIVDATNEDGLLRYYGYSYGTALGATVSAMFPSKVDKVVLDGVLNPTSYFYGYDWEMWADTDAVFSQFFQQCMLHPNECALAHGNATAESLEAATWAFIDQIKKHPIPYQGYIFDDVIFKVTLRTALYGPARWPVYARYLNGLLTGNMTQFAEADAIIQAGTPPVMSAGTGDDSTFGIHCTDKMVRASNFDEFKLAIDEFWSTSRLQGDLTNYLVAMCSQWFLEPKERYMGGFKDIKTRKPLLVIGNTWDPATPLKSAKNVTEGFEGAVLLQQNSYGHCTSAQPSLCTARAIKNYFEDGILPDPGTVCQPENHPFSGKQSLEDFYDVIDGY